MDSNRFKKISEFHKSASKVGRRSASGINFSYAESALSKENPGVSLSKEQVLERILEDPVFSNEDLDSIFEINIENHHAKMMNKKERAFIEIGAFLTQKQDHIQEIGDYLISESAKPGWIEERYGNSFSSKESITEAFSQLDQAQRDFHEEAARRDAEERTAAGRFGNGYETNEVIKEFEDGWKVVYVPAAGEGPNYKGNPSKSNDRTVEGNILGLCLGASSGLYQTNGHGKIYSVRDPGNNPRVTIRIHNNILQEAKGKNNLTPDVEAAKKAVKWFESQDELQYKDSQDFQQFPPLNAQDAKNKFERNPDEAYSKGWVVSWYGSGVTPIDDSVEERVASRDISIIRSGLGKKYKHLAQPVVEYWAKKWIEEDDAKIWANFNPTHLSHLSHESWKTYRKESWMIDAVEKLMTDTALRPGVPRGANFGLKIGIQNIPEYVGLARPAAKLFAEDLLENPGSDVKQFFEQYKLQNIYPDIGATLGKKLAVQRPVEFFEANLQDIYPSLEAQAAERVAEEAPYMFARLGLRSTYPHLFAPIAADLAERAPAAFLSKDLPDEYPELVRPAVERLARSGSIEFFSLKLHIKYPELGFSVAKNIAESPDWDIFFLHDLQELYPDLGVKLAKKLAEKDPRNFFSQGLEDTYPNLEFAAAKVLADLSYDKYNEFFTMNVYKKYPELGISRAKSLVEENHLRFFELNLQDTYPKIGLQKAKLLARKDPDTFFAYKLSDSYPDLTLLLAKDLVASSRPGAWDQIKFFSMGLHHNFPELAHSAAESIATINPAAFVEKKFKNLFPPPHSEAEYSLGRKYPSLAILAEISRGGAVPDELPDEEIGRGDEVPFGSMDKVNPYFSMYEKEDEEPENFYNYPDFNQEEPSDLDFVDPEDSPPPTYVLPENAVSEVEVTKRRSKLSSLQSYLNKSGLEKEADEVGVMIESFVKESGLDRWFKEKWVDISKKDKSGKHPPCGREDADKGKYPKCRPSKRVSSKTPKTTKELSSKDKKKAVKDKRKAEKKKSKPAGGGSRKPKRAPSLKRKKSSAETYLTKLSRWLYENGFSKEYNELIALSRYNMSKKRR